MEIEKIVYVRCSPNHGILVHTVYVEGFATDQENIKDYFLKIFVIEHGGQWLDIINQIKQLLCSAGIVYFDTSDSRSMIPRLIAYAAFITHQAYSREFPILVMNGMDQSYINLVRSVLTLPNDASEKELYDRISNAIDVIGDQVLYENKLLNTLSAAMDTDF